MIPQEPRAKAVMVLISIFLHLVCVGSVVLFSGVTKKETREREIKVSGIKLVSEIRPPAAKPVKMKDRAPAANLEKVFENMVKKARKVQAPANKVQELERAELPATEKKRIKVAKKRRPKESKPPAKKKISKKKRSDRKRDRVVKKKHKKEREPEFDAEKHLAERLAQIRKRVSRRKERPDQTRVWEQDATAGGVTVDSETLAWFRNTRNLINSHWSVVELDPTRTGTTIIGVMLSDSGELVSATIETSSGNDILDLSALRAVRLAAPFPAPPERLKKKIEESGGLALRFTPSGVM